MSAAALWLALPLLAGTGAEPGTEVQVGSKKFTESVILGELLARLATEAGAEARHRRELGGTRVLWSALLAGELDLYPEYTGTLLGEILAEERLGEEELAEALAKRGLAMSAPLGFNNTYAIGMRRDRAAALGIERVSDLAAHPDLALGFGNEFLDRSDGWPGLRRAYGLPHRDVRGLDHDLAYRGLEAGSIEAIDLYSTDAEIGYYDLLVLEDDRGFFPRYDCVIVWRQDLEQRAPEVVRAVRRLEGLLDEGSMAGLNARVKLDGESEARVAADWLAAELGLEGVVEERSLGARLWQRTREHLFLVAVALLLAIVTAVPLGVIAARTPALTQPVLAAVGILQTLPSLALLALLIPWTGLGAGSAIAALYLYGLLPIVRNTCQGLTDIAPELDESARALGLPSGERLRRIELPLASRSILSGIKTASVLAVGTATLGALIGAGGYGQPILTGIRLDDTALICEGAIPAALLAVLLQLLFELLEKLVVPRGLRLRLDD